MSKAGASGRVALLAVCGRSPRVRLVEGIVTAAEFLRCLNASWPLASQEAAPILQGDRHAASLSQPMTGADGDALIAIEGNVARGWCLRG